MLKLNFDSWGEKRSSMNLKLCLVFFCAGVAELADALASGASGVKSVEVQILSSAPDCDLKKRI